MPGSSCVYYPTARHIRALQESCHLHWRVGTSLHLCSPHSAPLYCTPPMRTYEGTTLPHRCAQHLHRRLYTYRFQGLTLLPSFVIYTDPRGPFSRSPRTFPKIGADLYCLPADPCPSPTYFRTMSSHDSVDSCGAGMATMPPTTPTCCFSTET